MGAERGRSRRRHRLAVRISAGIGAMLLPVLLAFATGGVAFHSMTNHIDKATEQSNREVLPIGNLRGEMGPLAAMGFEAAAGLVPRATWEAQRTRFGHELDNAIVVASDSQERGALREASAAWAIAVQTINHAITSHEFPTPQKLAATAQRFRTVDRHLSTAEAAALRAVHDAAERSDAVEQSGMWVYLAVALVALGSAVVIAIALVRSITRPVRRLREGVQRIGGGDLVHQVDLQRRDELGELGDAIDHMAHDLHRAQEELAHQALHDALTGLPNRALLQDRIEQATHRLSRRDGLVALLLVDLDDFKSVNDTMGHPAGDTLLKMTAQRLLAELRDVDTASRIGGDEFALLIENLEDDVEAVAVADRIRRAIAEPCEIDGTEMRPRASIGVATCSEGRENGAELLRNADLAMYAAKELGKNRCELFATEMHTEALERAALERALRNAVRRDEMMLHYQPTIDLATGRMTGAEALIRWRHPELGMLSPTRFIPLAEETGIIVPLGRWVLREACSQLVEWQRVDPERFAEFTISVNLSTRQLERPGVVADVQHALEQSGLNPRHLVLELTESMLASGDDLNDRLDQLHGLGVRLAVDDFGTGYSSLAYLRRFPIDVLKIDRSFVAGIAARHTDATLASTIIELGRLLDLTTVAEGIEEQDQLDLLRSLGCRIGQGFLFAKPLPPEQLERMISDTPVFELPALQGSPTRIAGAQHLVMGNQAEMLSKLVDNAADALALIDSEGTLLFASEAVHRLLGYPLDERIGRDTLELVHPDDLPGVLEALVSTIATPGLKSPLALRMRCADGSWKPIEIISNNMLDEPSIGGIVVMMRDRTEPTIAAADNVTTVIGPVVAGD